MKRFDEYRELTEFLYGDTVIRLDLLINTKMKIESTEEAVASLHFILPYIENGDYISLDTLKAPILAAIAESGKKNGQILWPTRVALSGQEFSP